MQGLQFGVYRLRVGGYGVESLDSVDGIGTHRDDHGANRSLKDHHWRRGTLHFLRVIGIHLGSESGSERGLG